MSLKVCAVVVVGAGAVLTALYPRICAAARSVDAMRGAVNTLLGLGVLLYSGVFLALALLATEFIELFFGHKFAPAGEPLALLAVTPMLNIVDMLYGMTFIALKRIWTYLIVTAVATVVNVGAALILIPWLEHNGAALATVVSSVVVVALGTHQLSRALGGPVLWNVILWPGICFLVAASCATLISNPWAATAGGLAAFCIVALVARNKLRADWRSLEALSFRAGASE
jgi:O-antigen/teichoic acid export membrane protein